MQSAPYYQEQAERAERLASLVTDKAVETELHKIAEDYRDIALDLQNGAIEIRHPELMPQRRHKR
ncbi:MAG TPA: hypothetical protein VG328_25830 [Stellaceae bacterium]|jgi:hypothetical protein|nr:hypothetical protein [Stellaceae bacterium]